MKSLERFWLFADLTAAEWRHLEPLAVRHCFPGRHMLFRKGDPTPGLHLVEEGAVKIFAITPEGEERIITIIGPGEVCGEMGVVDAAPSSAWGQTMGSAVIRVIPAAACERVLLTHPQICLKICRVLVAKLRSAGLQLDETLFLKARDRVLRQLIRLAERHGRAEAGAVRVPLRLTHRELACLAGTARETVSRVLAELQGAGLLRSSERQMVFQSTEALRRYAGVAAASGGGT